MVTIADPACQLQAGRQMSAFHRQGRRSRFKRPQFVKTTPAESVVSVVDRTAELKSTKSMHMHKRHGPSYASYARPVVRATCFVLHVYLFQGHDSQGLDPPTGQISGSSGIFFFLRESRLEKLTAGDVILLTNVQELEKDAWHDSHNLFRQLVNGILS